MIISVSVAMDLLRFPESNAMEGLIRGDPPLQCALPLTSRSRSMSATHASRNPNLTPLSLSPREERNDSLLPLGEGAGTGWPRAMRAGCVT